jgi:hypothetical protein
MTENFVVYVLRPLCQSKDAPLRDVVLVPEIPVVEHFLVIERVSLGEQITW